jgi:hypothetical protein
MQNLDGLLAYSTTMCETGDYSSQSNCKHDKHGLEGLETVNLCVDGSQGGLFGRQFALLEQNRFEQFATREFSFLKTHG